MWIPAGRAFRLVAISVVCVVICCWSISAAVTVPSGTAGGSVVVQGASDLVTTPYKGPAVTITVRSVASVPQTVVNVSFPTGGWELRADSSTVKDGVAVARLTVIGPAASDMVTQALVERPWTLPAKEPFSRVEVWVNVVRRDAPVGAPEYRLAARYPASSTPDAALSKPAPTDATPLATTYRCGDETFRIAFEEGRASMTLSDGSVAALERLKSAAGDGTRTFTNGRLTLVQEIDQTRGGRVRFARGRMVPSACTAVE